MTTVQLVTPVAEIAKMIEDGIRGHGEESILQHPDVDPPIREVGNAIILMARARLSSAASSEGEKKRKEAFGSARDVGVIARIGWAKEPIIHGDRTRMGLVASGHPASVRWEFGTSGAGSRKGYSATLFFAGAAMAIAAQNPGVIFIHHPREAAVPTPALVSA